MTRIGRLSEQITLKTTTTGTADGIGGRIPGAIVTLATDLWASIDPVPAKLAIRYQGPQNSRFYNIVTRTIPEINLKDSKYWIEWGSKKLTVYSTDDAFNRGDDLQILAFEIV
jgi:hypothetical protein